MVLNGGAKVVNFNDKLKLKRKPSVSIDGIEINLDDVEPGTITLDQYRKVRANTPGYQALYAKLDDEALAEAVRNTLNNCYGASLYTYEEALQKFLVPELLKRLEGAIVREGAKRT